MMVGREWISTVDENHRQYEFPSYWGVNAERGFASYDSYSESYNPGWQNHFNYWDEEEQMRYQPPPSPMQAAPQTSNSGMSLEDIVESLALTTLQFQQDTMAGLQETKACLQLLGNQISQLATSISKLEAQASQQTEVNPENASMTPQSRNELHMIEQAPMEAKEDEKTLEYTEVQNEKVESNLIPPPSSNTFALLFPCSVPKSEEDEKEITLNKGRSLYSLLFIPLLCVMFYAYIEDNVGIRPGSTTATVSESVINFDGFDNRSDMQMIIKEHINPGLIDPRISAYSSPGFLLRNHDEIKRDKPRLIVSKNMKDHIKHLEIFSDASYKEGLVLFENKATIAVNKIEFLGILIDETGIQLQEHIVQKIRNFPDVLKDKKLLQSFLGVVNFIDLSTACTRPSLDSGETATNESERVQTSDDSSQPSASGVKEEEISLKPIKVLLKLILTNYLLRLLLGRVWMLEGSKPVEVREWYEFGALALVHTMSPSFPEISKLPEWISGAVHDSWQNNPHLKRGDILELKFISAAPGTIGKGSHPAFHFVKLQRPDMVAFKRIKVVAEEAPLVSAISEDDISTRRAWGL
ncbi:putative enzymatic polyprotein [Sesamum angolense]|uniref:Enzymatic polyprotein n=1 Tax=Sesamum angolense TaxID=2727404 RepID=A0AAE1VYD8_9LAMI|nr:putative enzymatic polyprotein [Sesamum angolense]